MKIYNENNEELVQDTLDYTVGYLTKKEGTAHDYIYHFFTEEQLKQIRIADYTAQLEETNEFAIKYADGLIDEQEYSEIKAQRQALRNEILNLEG